MKTLLSSLAVLGALLGASQAGAAPTNFSFTGTFAQDNDVQLFNFTADGSSAVTFRSYSYAGGTQANGNVVARGGFDPILALFNSSGELIAQQDDDTSDNDPCDGNFDSLTGACWDTYFTEVLGAGAYTVAIMQFDNFAIVPNLANGFVRDASPNFTSAFGCSNGAFCDVSGVAPHNNRTNQWAFDILNVERAAQIPEPGTLLLAAIAAAGAAVFRRKAAV